MSREMLSFEREAKGVSFVTSNTVPMLVLGSLHQLLASGHGLAACLPLQKLRKARNAEPACKVSADHPHPVREALLQLVSGAHGVAKVV